MKRKSILLSFILFATFALNSFSQQVHTIGTGTVESIYPPASAYFNYAWSSVMYTSDEVGDAKTITKIAFYQTVDWGGYWEYAVLPNQKIYIKQTNDASFGTLAYEDPGYAPNGYTLVYDDSVHHNLGWCEIELDAPFVYDGTSNLIIHYENHRGALVPANVNVKFYSTTVTDNLFKANSSDAGFPTDNGAYIMDRPNIALTYESDGPGTPLNPTPLHESIKVLLDGELQFDIGTNTTAYDLYLSTTNPPTDLLVSDVAVTGSGTYSENPSETLGELLDSQTEYFWKVVAKNSTSSTESDVWSFTTQDLITPPYIQGFEDTIIRNFNADETDWSWPLVGAANWRSIDYQSHTGNICAACNVWGEYIGDYSLTTPRIKLAENYRMKYWWLISGGSEGDAKVSGEMDTHLEITTDGGENWTTLKSYTSDMASEEWEQEIINLSSYTGDNCYIRWRYVANSHYQPYYFNLDDFELEPIPNNAVMLFYTDSINFPEVCMDGKTTKRALVTNIGTQDLVITGYSTNSQVTCEYPASVAPDATDTITFTVNGTTLGAIDEMITFQGDFNGDDDFIVTGNIYPKVESIFENYDQSLEMPAHWNVIRTKDPYDQFTTVSIKEDAYDAHSQPNAAKMQKMNDTVSPLIFVTPGTRNFDNNVLKFYAKKGDNYNVSLVVGVMDDAYNADAFEPIDTLELEASYKDLPFSVAIDTLNTKPYIGLSFIGGSYSNSIWVDDFSWETEAPVIPNPAVMIVPDSTETDVNMMIPVPLQWTSNGGNPTGFKLSLGTNPEANNMLNELPLGIDVIEYQIAVSDLEYNTQYYWKVVPYNAEGDAQDCPIWPFRTMEDPTVTVYPFTENFDEVEYTPDFDCPLGWSLENTNNDNFTWDILSNQTTPSWAHSSPHSMHMLFSLAEMNDWLFTPPMEMEEGYDYNLSFWLQTVGDQYVPNPIERLAILVGTTNNSQSMVIDEIYTNESIDNQTWELQTAKFTPSMDGVYFLGFKAYSTPNQGLLSIDDIEVTETPVGIDNLNNNSSMVISNLINNELIIANSSSKGKFHIYNISGQKITEFNGSEEKIQLNVSAWQSGMYIIQYVEGNNSKVEKIIVE